MLLFCSWEFVTSEFLDHAVSVPNESVLIVLIARQRHWNLLELFQCWGPLYEKCLELVNWFLSVAQLIFFFSVVMFLILALAWKHILVTFLIQAWQISTVSVVFTKKYRCQNSVSGNPCLLVNCFFIRWIFFNIDLVNTKLENKLLSSMSSIRLC